MQKRVPLSKYWMIAIFSIVTAVGLNNVILFLNLAKYSEAYREAAEILFAPDLVEQILYTGILIPIIEEVIFRGGIFRLLRRKLSFLWAMMLSTVLFGLYHGNLVQFVYASAMGMLLAYAYETYGSLTAPLLAHMLANITVCILSELDGFAWMFAVPVRVIAITLACVAASCYAFVQIQTMDKISIN